jgi:TolB protein
MDVDGSNEMNLTNNAANDRIPIFSPDGQKIIFCTNRDDNDEIYMMNLDGSNPVNITNNEGDDGSDGSYDIYLSE